MNKAITDGIQLTPPAFEFGLDVWSSENGTPGSDTYDGAANATLIAADADFGGCLELLKSSNTQRLRYTGETPMLVGSYWQVRARVKAISGPLPSVRIAGWAGAAGGGHVSGLVETGPSTALTTYGEVVEVTAIVGSGARNGVDMIWGQAPVYGHFGIDLTGANNGVVRIDDIVIEDVTAIYTGKKLDIVDVTDFGAVGDGATDNVAAFEAADAAAQGRTVLVPEGIYHLDSTLTMNSEVRFHGTITMPGNARCQFLKNFDYPTYVSAFGDEKTALEKALQALFNYSDHDSLDLMGRSVDISGPIDVHAAVGNKNSYSTRRVLRNGRISADSSASWDDVQVTRNATYDPDEPTKLTGVNNPGGVPVGALVTAGQGVGREVYVRDVDTQTGEITLSNGLWGAPTSQQYTFTRFQYLLDFSGFNTLSRFVLENIDLSCNGRASGVMLADDGLIFHVKDCFFTTPKDRGLTSKGRSCSGMMIDRCQFLSNEQPLAVSQRTSVGFNTNGNDVKIRNNRALRFKHWAVIGGSGSVITGNHWFQDDPTGGTERSAGIVIAENNPKSLIVGNYVDNSYIDWTNEHDATPSITTGFSFGSLTITGNIFTAAGAATWFRWLHISPFGTGHFLNGITITGNVFKAINGPSLERVELLDDSVASLDTNKARNVNIHSNSFHNVDAPFMNPVTMEVDQTAASNTWQADISRFIPFDQKARFVSSMIAQGPLRNTNNGILFDVPYFLGGVGSDGKSIELKWKTPVKGKARVTVRCDETV